MYKSERMMIYALREFRLFYILELLMVRDRSKIMGLSHNNFQPRKAKLPTP